MRILITGGSGQLGQQLLKRSPKELNGEAVDIYAPGREQLDLSIEQSCLSIVDSYRPSWIINAGAYTAVDRAEQEKEVAFSVNASAPAALARALQKTGGRMLQISTDYVFDGHQNYPYQPHDAPNPLSVYGLSKAAGESAVKQELSKDNLCILRTSWVYGPVGKNFLLTILHLLQERSDVSIVCDQVGCPTATFGLADVCWSIVEKESSGTYHWSDAGVASWYDFAVAISEIAQSQGLLIKPAIIHPIPASDYPTSAARPIYSLLDTRLTQETIGKSSQHWRAALAEVLLELSCDLG